MSASSPYLSLFEMGSMVSLVYRGIRRSWEQSHDLQDDTALASMARDQEPSRKQHTELIQHSWSLQCPSTCGHLLTASAGPDGQCSQCVVRSLPSCSAF